MRRECRERFPRHRLQRKPLVSDPGIHHGTCVRHVPWCMSWSLTSVGGENVPGILGACATRNFTYLARGPWLGAVLCKRLFLKTIVQIRLTFKHSRVHYPCVSSVASIKLRLDSTKGFSVDEHCPLELRDMDLASLVCLHGNHGAIITTFAQKTPTFQRPVVIYRTRVYTCNYKRNGHYGDVIKGALASQITSLTIFTQPFIQTQIKENIKAPRHWPLCGESRWIPRTNGQ